VISIHSQPNQASTFIFVHLPLLTFYLCLSLPSDIFCSGSLSQISHAFVFFPVHIALPNHFEIDVISGFCRGVNDIVALMGFYAI
jgi:hypothetical protein